MKRAVAAVGSFLVAFIVSDFARAQPYFEVSGGASQLEGAVAGGNFIPQGAFGWDSHVVGTTVTAATVRLREPGRDGQTRTVCVDYVGTDAAFENRFVISGTSIDWCNKATCTTPSAAPVGAGLKNWTGPFARNACFQATVGQIIPFVFVGDLQNQGGDGGNHTVGNGQAIAQAHWAVLPLPFVLNPEVPPSQSAPYPVIALGLSDGAFNPAVDNDHQDFAVRLTVLGGPSDVVGVPTLSEWTLIGVAFLVVLFGLRGLRKAS